METYLLGNELVVGTKCLYLQAWTQVRLALVEVLEIKEKGLVCKVINPNPTASKFRGCFWNKDYITKPLAPTNLMVYRG